MGADSHDRKKWLNRLVAYVTRLNWVRFGANEGMYVTKRRLWHSQLLIIACNLIMRRMRVPSVILSRSDWYEREIAVCGRNMGDSVSIEDGCLVMPIIPGSDVEAVLHSADIGWNEKLRAVRAASASLRALHGTRADQADVSLWQGGHALLTHGDATARNVMYDPETDSAVWFDFEQMHCPGTDLPECQADDLRAFLFSAAVQVREDELESLFSSAIDAYGYSPALEALRSLLRKRVWEYDLYHLAQSTFNLQRQRICRKLLMEELDKWCH